MGGDCLNLGCIPSKALLAAAKSAVAGKKAEKFGVRYAAPKVDYAAVMDHVHDVIAQIAPHDSVERFEGLGVRVIQSAGQFISPGQVQAGDYTIQAKRFILATGSQRAHPPFLGWIRCPI